MNERQRERETLVANGGSVLLSVRQSAQQPTECLFAASLLPICAHSPAADIHFVTVKQTDGLMHSIGVWGRTHRHTVRGVEQPSLPVVNPWKSRTWFLTVKAHGKALVC